MIHTVPETGSTNADLAARLRAGEALAEGDWLVADRQTAGKGRLGREWFDGTGNFMGSTVVRLGENDPPAPTLALVAGLAVFEALQPHAQGLSLKWPNDVLLGGAKLAGILLERVDEAVVVGIGVNLVSAPDIPERPATALPGSVERDAFAAALAETFADELARWRATGTEPLFARWLAAAHPVGASLTVHEPGGAVLSGTFAGLDADGALLLRLADGATRAIHAGDVSLEAR